MLQCFSNHFAEASITLFVLAYTCITGLLMRKLTISMLPKQEVIHTNQLANGWSLHNLALLNKKSQENIRKISFLEN